MPNQTWPSIHAKKMRLTKLDDCGAPVIGPKSTLVTSGIVKISLSAEYEDGEETVKKNGDGKICVQFKDPDQLKYLSPEIEFCRVDPEAYSMITGMPLVLDGAATPNPVGLKFGSYDVDANFALEVWTDIPGAACGAGAKPYGRFILPFIGSGRLGDIDLEVAAASFTLSAQTKGGTGWGVGPYNDAQMTSGATPAPGPLLEALTDKDHLVMFQSTIAPPADTAGAVALA